MKCKNCGESVSGNFCTYCGQSTRVGKINLPNFLQELSASVFQVEKGLFFTIWEVLIRPGTTLRNFIQGKRKNYFKPFAFLLTLSTIYILLAEVTDLDTWFDAFYTGWMAGASDTQQDSHAQKVLGWFVINYRFSTLALLPVFSLASYLSFRKFGYNYLEHVVINCYISGMQALIYAVCTLGEALLRNEVVESASFFVSMGFNIWAFWDLFVQAKPLSRVLRTILTYFLYLIFGSLLLFAAMALTKLA